MWFSIYSATIIAALTFRCFFVISASLSLSVWRRTAWWRAAGRWTTRRRRASVSFSSWILLLFLLFFVLFLSFTLFAFLFFSCLYFRQVILLNLFNDFFHLDGIIHDGISSFFLPFLNQKHRVFMNKREVFAFIISDLFLKNMLKLFSRMRISFFLSGEILFIGFLLLDFISPVVHPLHSIEMGLRN